MYSAARSLGSPTTVAPGQNSRRAHAANDRVSAGIPSHSTAFVAYSCYLLSHASDELGFWCVKTNEIVRSGSRRAALGQKSGAGKALHLSKRCRERCRPSAYDPYQFRRDRTLSPRVDAERA
ncbi:hypothetical protein L1887_54089 [Cichorium endivia]|nr:hypothetical protein L1887_54089 [Cichorium endivia]